MKKIAILFMITMFIFTASFVIVDGDDLAANETASVLSVSDTEKVVTVKMMADYLETKKEHYPLSDEFIERFQQTDGGYIEKAEEDGILVDKELHSPNQKWHFFESWLYPSIEEGKISWEDSAQSRVYTRLLCPELLLWMYEACEVDPIKVREAKDIAETAKILGAKVMPLATMASAMRKVVTWDDVKEAIVNFDGGTSEPVITYSVSVEQKEGFSVIGLDEKYAAGRSVNFTINVTDLTKQIDEVKANGNILTPVSGKNYKFTMPEVDVTITITLKEKTVNTPTEAGSVAVYDVVYDLNGSKQAKKLETAEDILKALVLASGDNIIESVSSFSNVFGGGKGGSGETAWLTGDLLKLGTTSVTGGLILNLNTEVNCIKITGYVHKSSCKIQVNETSLAGSVHNMNVISKDALNTNQTSTITINFDTASEISIEVLNAVALYITSIEFIYNAE